MPAATARSNPARHWSIRTAVLVAPAIIIVLMLGVIVVFDQALRRQQAEYEQVVQGPLTRATSTTTKLLLDVSEVQAAVMRYTRLRQRLSSEDAVLRDLREAILARYEDVTATLDSLKDGAAGPGESDVIANVEDFLTIHRAVSTRIISGGSVDSMAMSTVMAHYQQLQSYIAELAERFLESAQVTVAETEQAVSELSRALMLGSAVVILLSIGVTVYVGRAISRPLTQMISILTAIAAGERIGEVPGCDRKDEIGSVARAIAVFDVVTQELREHERSLNQARLAAEAANATKSAFLANVSHELRTPLTSILGFTQIIKRRLERVILPAVHGKDQKVDKAAEQVCVNIDIIVSEGERLTSLINNLLDLEKIEAGEMRWDIVPTDVADVLRHAGEATRSLYMAKGLRFQIEVETGVSEVLADKDKLIQVLVNLISNAVKFTDRGQIKCAARMRSPDTVEFSVSDTGCGIAIQDQFQVFEKFRQVGDSLTNKPSGTGLGLPICREIVSHLGGEIWVESEMGVGSVFRFHVPAPTTSLERATGHEEDLDRGRSAPYQTADRAEPGGT